MSTQTETTPTDTAIIDAIESARTTFAASAEVVKRATRPYAHETLDAMVKSHERLCALATTLVRT